MNSAKRKSTVHDLASLRLHPDGTRVSTSQIKKRRKEKHAVPDRQGNWTAADAGGLGRVKIRRLATKEEAVQESGEEGEPGQSVLNKGKERATGEEEEEDDEDVGIRKPLKDRRAKRRRAFQDDMLLLESAGSQPERNALLPGSDLLKCIHYFTSTYYSGMGQLHNSTREYRREKKRRRLERLQKQNQASASKSPSTSSNEESSGDESSSDESVESKVESQGGKSSTPRKRDSSRSNTSTGVDMYKVFDGSALVAIGMLLQHHVEEQLKTNIPEGWEEAMDKAERVEVRRGRKPRGVPIAVEEPSILVESDEDVKESDTGMPFTANVVDDDDDDFIP